MKTYQAKYPKATDCLVKDREVLAKQLCRHGLALSAGSLAAVLSARPAAASVPMSLVASKAKVAILTERMRDMFVAKLKVTAVLVLVLAGLGGGAAFFHRALAGEQSGRSTDSAPGRKLADRDGDKPVMEKESIVWGEAVNGLRRPELSGQDAVLPCRREGVVRLHPGQRERQADPDRLPQEPFLWRR